MSVKNKWIDWAFLYSSNIWVYSTKFCFVRQCAAYIFEVSENSDDDCVFLQLQLQLCILSHGRINIQLNLFLKTVTMLHCDDQCSSNPISYIYLCLDKIFKVVHLFGDLVNLHHQVLRCLQTWQEVTISLVHHATYFFL